MSALRQCRLAMLMLGLSCANGLPKVDERPVLSSEAPQRRHAAAPRRLDGSPTGSLACLASTIGARLTVRFGHSGCFGGTEDQLDVTRQQAGFVINAILTRFDRKTGELISTRATDAVVAEDVGLTLIARLAAHVDRQQVAPDLHDLCVSTTHTVARLRLVCDERERRWFFDADSCPRPHAGPEPQAIGLSREAAAALSAVPLTTGPATAAEKARERRRWSTVYVNGQRVSHDPVDLPEDDW